MDNKKLSADRKSPLKPGDPGNAVAVEDEAARNTIFIEALRRHMFREELNAYHAVYVEKCRINHLPVGSDLPDDLEASVE